MIQSDKVADAMSDLIETAWTMVDCIDNQFGGRWHMESGTEREHWKGEYNLAISSLDYLHEHWIDVSRPRKCLQVIKRMYDVTPITIPEKEAIEKSIYRFYTCAIKLPRPYTSISRYKSFVADLDQINNNDDLMDFVSKSVHALIRDR